MCVCVCVCVCVATLCRALCQGFRWAQQKTELINARNNDDEIICIIIPKCVCVIMTLAIVNISFDFGCGPLLCSLELTSSVSTKNRRASVCVCVLFCAACVVLSLAEKMEVMDVDGIPTHVFHLETVSHNDCLLLVVPGSPGASHFYIPFAKRLFDLGRGAYDVSVVSHAGHSPGVYRQPRPDEEGVERDWFALEDQISHKLAFLRERAEHKTRLYLVGHSIGCYIILNMLKHLTQSRVKKILFLFPTIERMSATPNGVSQRPLFTTLRLPFTGTVWLTGGHP